MNEIEDREDAPEAERIHALALERFDLCESADSENRQDQLDDIEFVKLKKQWPDAVRSAREESGRPCLTIDQLGSVVRQVVNDSRLNKPQIKVKPVDSASDPKTAEIIAGLIRNIEYASNSDVAYDTAIDYAVSSGRGYFRINAEYASDDTFDQDLVIERISDPLSVYPDPYSTEADSSDWNWCFVVDSISEDEYARRYGDRDFVSWDSLSALGNSWFGGDRAVIAEYWTREEVERYAVMLSSGEVVKADEMPEMESVWAEGVPMPGPDGQPAVDEMGEQLWLIEPVIVQAVRPVRSWKVRQHVMSGKEILETVEWPGVFIPIVPVYGEDFVVEGKRYFSSLIRPAKDAQRMKNYWRSTTTELVALAPRAPWVGPETAFQGEDAAKWETANSDNWSYLAYKGNVAPQRQPFNGVPAGALQEALNAADDIKSITGIFDASLGARSNETSGRAILARQREGDVSTFHFIDNLSRAIRHAGRILVDLIPHFYSTERVIRVLNPEGESNSVRIGSPEQMQESMQRAVETQQEIEPIYALGVGKYDVAVEAGPSFTTQREEAVAALTEMMRAAPQYSDILGPILLKNLDFPGVDEVLDEIKARMEAAAQQQQQGEQPDPAVAAEAAFKMQELQMKAQAEQEKAALEAEKLRLEAFKAETDRLKVQLDAQRPRPAPRTYA